MQDLGYNYRLTDFQAALANSQLKRADAGLAQRQKIAERYQHAFQHLPVRCPEVATGVQHAWHLYVIQTEKRKALYDALREKQIFCQVHYIPVHLQPYYQQLGWKPGDFQVAEAYYKRCLSLPMYPSLTEEQQSYVIESVLQFFSGN
jgi:dTDP-4-amino-4,6-dideoxygalactose transaminase